MLLKLDCNSASRQRSHSAHTAQMLETGSTLDLKPKGKDREARAMTLVGTLHVDISSHMNEKQGFLSLTEGIGRDLRHVRLGLDRHVHGEHVKRSEHCVRHATSVGWIKLLGNGLETVPCDQQVTRNVPETTTNTPARCYFARCPRHVHVSRIVRHGGQSRVQTRCDTNHRGEREMF